MRYPVIILSLLPFFLSCTGNQQPASGRLPGHAVGRADSLRQRLTDFISTRKAEVGIAVAGPEDGDTLSINGHRHYAMMSVAKFPQALAMLRLVDEGKFSMAQRLHFSGSDLLQRTGSGILKDHPQAAFDLTLPEALKYSIGQSDNITSNKIFALEGGPAAVEDYVHRAGITEIGIATNYAHMKQDSLFLNWSSPWAMAQLLEKFFGQRLLSDSSRNLLWQVMVEGTSGPNRLKGGLPAGTIIGHKTGTSGTDSTSGITPAFNDVGIVQLPNGKHYAIAVFVKNSTETETANAAIIARISKEVWDYFLAINGS